MQVNVVLYRMMVSFHGISFSHNVEKYSNLTGVMKIS